MEIAAHFRPTLAGSIKDIPLLSTRVPKALLAADRAVLNISVGLKLDGTALILGFGFSSSNKIFFSVRSLLNSAR